MEQVQQLKKMRDEAMARLQFNPDYKLLVSLDRLIREMEQLVASTNKVASSASVVSTQPAPQANAGSNDDIDTAFDKIANELKEEMEGSMQADVNANIKSAIAQSGDATR